MNVRVRRALPAAVVVGSILLACAWIMPKSERNPLLETAIWSLLLLVSFGGWGSLVAFVAAPRERVDLGLRVVWGASLVCAVAGLLMVPALMGRATAMLLVEIGVGLAIVEAVRAHARIRRAVRFGARFTRLEPRIVGVFAIGAVLLAIHYLAGISESHTNPYDDDIAYFPFVKQLLARGTILEPFSFRRLSALGGQTLYLALVWLRSDVGQANTFDRSVCVLVIALLVAGHRTRGRRVPPLVVIAAIAMLLTLPLSAINTASYYSGVAFFLGLFRSMTWAAENDSRSPWRSAIPLALVAAATCTLRQNYLAVPVFVFAVSYGLRLWYTRTRHALLEPVWTAGLTILFLAPWMVVAWQSNRTFLYPIMSGTFNKALALTATDWSVFRELNLDIWTFLEGLPARGAALFVLAAAFVRERAARRPLLSLALGVAFGFFALVHGLSQGDAGNIGRYAFGSVVAFMLAVMLSASTERGPIASAPWRPMQAWRSGRMQIAAGIVLVASVAQMLDGHAQLFRFYSRAFANMEVLWHRPARTDKTLTPDWWLHSRLQGAVPKGERLAVLLDEPYHLDFGRNPIWNLDMPGYSSISPGMPFFQGSEALEAYFKTVGIRYIAFVRPEYSRYHYRRQYWIGILVDEMEIWRAFAPYIIDFIDSLKAISARHKTLFEERGLVVVDLQEAR